MKRTMPFLIILFLTILVVPSYALDPLQVLHTFRDPTGDGLWPGDSLVQIGSTLYGMTEDGGNYMSGTIFAIETDGSNYRVLHCFGLGANDGGLPKGSLTVSGSTLYGMTVYGGGSSSSGTIFAIEADGSNFRVLHSFGGPTGDGSWPYGSPTVSGSTLYGMTLYGGTSDKGTIFSVSTDGSDYRVLHSFTESATDGSRPFGNLLLWGSTLFGMTSAGGSSNKGTAFSIDADGSNFQILRSFSGGTSDGQKPEGSLILSDTTLYGMTSAGGASDKGIIFSMDTDGSNFQILHSFSGGTSDGRSPAGSLLLSGSKLYGMTWGGVYPGMCSLDCGTVFRIDTNGENLEVLHSFTGSDGSLPLGSLILSGSILYGTTRGDSGNRGTAFSLGTTPVYTLTVSDPGPGSVISSPASIECGAVCSAQFVSGTQVTLTATPLKGYALAYWGGGCKGASTICTVSMMRDITVYPYFVQQNSGRRSLNVVKVRTQGGDGAVTSDDGAINCGNSCRGLYYRGASVAVSAVPSGNSVFVGWGGACNGTGICNVWLDRSARVTARFAGPEGLTVTKLKVRGGTGTVASNPSGIRCGAACTAGHALFRHGETVTLTATPDEGSEFTGWKPASLNCPGTDPCTVTMDKPRSVVAKFTKTRN